MDAVITLAQMDRARHEILQEESFKVLELESVSQPVVGFYLATLASPLDFAYALRYCRVKNANGKREQKLSLCVGPRLRPWWRSLIAFPATVVMTTEVDREYFYDD